MSRRPRPKKRIPDLVWAQFIAHADKGLSTRLSDYAFWLPHDVDEELIEALATLDRSNGKNKQPLIELLQRRSDVAAYRAHRDFYFYLADLLERYQLKRKQGGQQKPLYEPTELHKRLMMAADDMREHGKSLDDAAHAWGIRPALLAEYRQGKRRPERAWERRAKIRTRR